MHHLKGGKIQLIGLLPLPCHSEWSTKCEVEESVALIRKYGFLDSRWSLGMTEKNCPINEI